MQEFLKAERGMIRSSQVDNQIQKKEEEGTVVLILLRKYARLIQISFWIRGVE